MVSGMMRTVFYYHSCHRSTTTSMPPLSDLAKNAVGLGLFYVVADAMRKSKSFDEELGFYGSYHQNPWNQLIHFVFIPTIWWSICVFMCYIPVVPLELVGLGSIGGHRISFGTFMLLLYSVGRPGIVRSHTTPVVDLQHAELVYRSGDCLPIGVLRQARLCHGRRLLARALRVLPPGLVRRRGRARVRARRVEQEGRRALAAEDVVVLVRVRPPRARVVHADPPGPRRLRGREARADGLTRPVTRAAFYTPLQWGCLSSGVGGGRSHQRISRRAPRHALM